MPPFTPQPHDPDRPARILLVDDEPRVLEGLRRGLRDHFHVTTAGSAVAGLAVVRAAAPDDPFAVVVSDLRMPGMDGVAFLEAVRAVAPLAARVLLTGRADLDTAAAAVNNAHVYAFLRKPCPPAELLATLRRATEWHHQQVAERARQAQLDIHRQQALQLAAQLAEVTGQGRAITHALANALALPVGLVELLQEERDLSASTRAALAETAQWLAAAEKHVRQLQDLAWSTSPPPSASRDAA
jgi:DNA-binding NtrC family response regulator